jgi:uncharacterized protein (DUF362 family)/Pyruvate/2-oxoacid:ferredoxin oxidoreductase delta subunit
MAKAQVSIVRANSYDPGEVQSAVAEAVRLTGGLEAVLGHGRRVLVKINHLPPPSPPERGIVTHPAFAGAVIRLLKEAGAEVTVGDDIEVSPRDGFSVSGFRQMCQQAGVRLESFRETGFAPRDCQGRLLRRVYLARAALEADVIVNLPKLKTHSLTVFTGGVKNMFGVIPASFRRDYHALYTRSEDFSLMLTDVYAAIRPALTIMDGIVAMEGDGPAAGGLRHLGVVLASRDAVALDAVAASIIGLGPAEVSTTVHAHERGLGIGKLEGIDILGEDIRSVSVGDFARPPGAMRKVLRWVPGPLARFLMSQRAVRPQVVESSCAACGECQKICPAGAISMDGRAARINPATCVRCLCCHEVCRYDAIALRQPAMGNGVQRAVGIARKLLR